MDIEWGDAYQVDTHGTGWFVGFGAWMSEGGPGLRCMPPQAACTGLAMKWMRHAAGDPRGTGKPVSVGRTLSIVVSEGGRFRLELSEHADFPDGATERIVLERAGQFCAWGAGLYHRYAVDADCTILTLRWVPADDRSRPAAPA
jgi:hypothetical protein